MAKGDQSSSPLYSFRVARVASFGVVYFQADFGLARERGWRTGRFPLGGVQKDTCRMSKGRTRGGEEGHTGSHTPDDPKIKVLNASSKAWSSARILW